jgi:DNA-directed RNA polymerase alpha subunit
MIFCEICGSEFDRISQIYNHKAYYKGKCKERIQEKTNKREAKRKLRDLDANKVVDAVNSTTQISELMKENMELKDQLLKRNEDYLKEFANDEIQKLKSCIKKLELYIEEQKDITSKADDVIRNCKCKIFRRYRQELE